MITIIDYGAGNIKSIKNMLKKIGVESNISNTYDSIKSADKLILPGVGHFGHGMRNLNETGLVELLKTRVIEDKIPLLGICLGAQLLANASEEAEEIGLGLIDMEVKRFDEKILQEGLKIPNMGWNEIDFRKDSVLTSELPLESRFYFVHSFHMRTIRNADVLATTNYGYEFVAAVEKENIFGVQFHPEKSHKFGMQLLKNFSKI